MSKNKIEELQSLIELCDLDIEDNAKNHKAHYQKATALVDLFHDSGNKEYLGQALKCYDEAIKLTQSKDSLYLANRSKLYVEMGQPDIAARDIVTISKLPSQTGIHGMYIGNTIKDIAKLDEIQSSINKLKANGKIDPSLAKALNEHAKITQSLVVQVDAHGNKLGAHEERIMFLEKALKELIAQNKISDESMKQLGIKVEEHERVMENLSLKAKSELNAGVEALKHDNPEAYEYYGKFYWTLMHTIEANGVINSGIVQGAGDAGFLSQSKLLNAGLEIIGGKVASYTNAALSGVPLLSSVINVLSLAVGDAYNAYKDMHFDSSVNAVNRIIMNKFANKEEMSFAIAKIAFEAASYKKGQISTLLADDQSDTGWLQLVIDKTKASLNEAKKLLGYVELYDTPAAKLAFQDTVLLALYLQENYGKIEQSSEPIITQLVEVVKSQPALKIIVANLRNNPEVDTNITSALLNVSTLSDQEVVNTRPSLHETKESEETEQKTAQKNCILMKVEVAYNNPVLKYNELIQQLLRSYGSNSVDKLIEFGMGFKTPEEEELIDDVLSGDTAFEDSVFMLGLGEFQHSAI